jgi:hypothetical protein
MPSPWAIGLTEIFRTLFGMFTRKAIKTAIKKRLFGWRPKLKKRLWIYEVRKDDTKPFCIAITGG